MTSSDRHASHDSPYRTGQHMPLAQNRHAPLTSIATSAMDSRPDLSLPYGEDQPGSSTALGDGWPGSPGALQSPTAPYSPGMRSSLALNRRTSNDNASSDGIATGEIQMQSFQEGLPPPPPVSHSWKRIDRWTEDNYEELYDQLAEGCTQNDLNELEHELDCSLPIEVRESLQCHDGQERGGRPTGIIFGCMLLDCEEIVQEWKNWRTVNEEYLTTPPNHSFQTSSRPLNGGSSHSSSSHQATNPLWRQELLDRQESQPPRAIQKAYAHPSWIPLARDWGGNNIAVDLAPGPQGKWGQIIIFGRDYDCTYVIARSWSAFLASVADDIGSEKVYVDEETQELKLKEFKSGNVEPAYLDILRWRMDQKYGRRGPKRKPASGPGANPHQRNSASSSPYDTPTEERGRSPHRFAGPGIHSSTSPRGVVGISSPLSQVSEETVRPLSIRLDTESRVSQYKQVDELEEVPTPGLSTNESSEKMLGTGMTRELSSDDYDKENQKELVNGLGVDGFEEMKSVAI